MASNRQPCGPLEWAKSAQEVSGNCREEDDEPCASLSTTLSESSSYSKLSSSKAKPYLVKPSASRNDFVIKTRYLRKGTKGGEMVQGQHEKGIITTGRNILIS